MASAPGKAGSPPPTLTSFGSRFGIFWLRGDQRGPGGALAEQMEASFNYWNADSGDTSTSSGPVGTWTGTLRTSQPTHSLDIATPWKPSRAGYSGQAELLLLSYDYWPSRDSGRYSPHGDEGLVDWSEVVVLPIEDMIRDGRIVSLDRLVHDLVSHARELQDAALIWELSNRCAREVGTQTIWTWLKDKSGLAGRVYEGVRPYVMGDLRSYTMGGPSGPVRRFDR